MALFEISGDDLQAVPLGTFGTLGLRERADIQRAVRANINAITPGVKTMVLAEEFGDWAGANRRIDLLCVDEDKNLVVVELKRDDGAHMDLQALRYAAMISTMRFDQAIEAHRKYLADSGSDVDPEQAIREFLEVEDGPVTFAKTVRIVLASANFSSELTTAVLWLNEQGDLDIRCVQMRPHAVDSRVLLDIQQVIPLPEAAQYTVALREKTNEQERVRATTSAARDTARYDLSIGQTFIPNLAKRRLILALVTEAIKQGKSPEQITDAIPWRRRNLFASAPGVADENKFQELLPGKNLRYFFADDERFLINGKTYVLNRAWGDQSLVAAENVRQLLNNADEVSWEPTSEVPDEVTYEGYTIRRREKGAIDIECDGRQISPVIATLRELAPQLGVATEHASGRDVNTQQLGARVMQAINSL
ncbi:hypothetical protein AWB76_06009 [Caballeronia temeraria]|uniref:Endonuclease NucS n=1 Tax=Caballeronia temeraria TaxID=1777137 RepID=A0A158CUT1_9BURK|nr:hypothetical protein [Caballeronia temeraria]SAK86078.1 hypothetical protein AWB76_06009 [Caballeronia temeraria]